MSRSIWKFFTSLKLTVVCLAFSVVLVFLGTLAQVNEGLWEAQARWFRSFFVWWNPGKLHIPIFPGGYLVGTLLLANLLAAHYKRFTWSPRKVGIQLTHLGVILLLLGGLLTDRLSTESLLQLRVGETKSYSDAHRKTEVVFASDAPGNQEEVVSIPGDLLARQKEITDPRLPVSVFVKEYQPNGEVYARATLVSTTNQLATALATVEAEFSTPDGLAAQAEKASENMGRREVWEAALKAIGEPAEGDLVAAAQRVAKDPAKGEKLCGELKTRFRSMMLTRFAQRGGAMAFAADNIEKGRKLEVNDLPAPATEGLGKEAAAFPLPEETDMDSQNLPYAVLELRHEGQSLGSWLVARTEAPQPITIAGKTYRLALRAERIYHDFSTTLLKVDHEKYLGSDIPKNFQSRVRINNPSTGEAREVDIYMNSPLRYAGLAFYQYQMGAEEAQMGDGLVETSTLQVVHNPGWLTPYLGCALVALGMLYQFLYHLISFISKRSQPRPRSSPADL